MTRAQWLYEVAFYLACAVLYTQLLWTLHPQRPGTWAGVTIYLAVAIACSVMRSRFYKAHSRPQPPCGK